MRNIYYINCEITSEIYIAPQKIVVESKAIID